MALQLAIVVVVPAPKAWAHFTGTTVLLRTAPVDPYDLLRGRYMRLGYADLDSKAVEALPGYAALGEVGALKQAYIELAPGEAAKPWKAIAVHRAIPANLAPGHVVMRCKAQYGRLDWQLDQYFIPEARGDAMESQMRADAGKATWAEVRVDSGGGAILEGLWIGGQRY